MRERMGRKVWTPFLTGNSSSLNAAIWILDSLGGEG